MDLGRKLSTVLGLVNVDDKKICQKVREFAKNQDQKCVENLRLQWASGDEDRLEQIQELKD